MLENPKTKQKPNLSIFDLSFISIISQFLMNLYEYEDFKVVRIFIGLLLSIFW